MSVLAIVEPLPVAAIGGTWEGAARLASPAPREAAVTAGGARTVDVDFGAAVTIDTIFVGYTSAADGAQFQVTGGPAGYGQAALGVLPVAASRRGRGRRHFLLVLPAPVTLRYLRLSMAAPAGCELGVFAAGLALRPGRGHEWGSGRFVVDTGAATRTLSGGWGLAPGARAGGWAWTLDLSDAEVDAVYDLQLAVGSTASVLVVEDPDAGPGLNERVHWGRLARLDPSERRAADSAKWELRVEDWA